MYRQHVTPLLLNLRRNTCNINFKAAKVNMSMNIYTLIGNWLLNFILLHLPYRETTCFQTNSRKTQLHIICHLT